MGSTKSIAQAAGSVSAAGQALACTLVPPEAWFSTRSFSRYQVSGFHSKGAERVRAALACHGCSSSVWELPKSTSA
jgi:hypothetical protein